MLNANILIVDDQIANTSLLSKILKQAGYRNIYSTTDSRETLTLYKEHNVDLLLLDIRMPHLDGFQVMQQLQSQSNNDYLPILVLTAELADETRSKALSGGAKDFLTKPFSREEVLLRCHNILEVRLLHNQILRQNEDLESAVKKRTKELEDSRLEIIQRLGVAAQYKDNETGNHVDRMSKFSQLLAKAAGLSDDFAEMILYTAPMHDIGKIGIPDHVLLKPGKLDSEEWEIMQSHVTIGCEILSGSESKLMIMAKNIALSHHERWNGTGYPNKISGVDIPIEARICAICDVFDALTSERPYKAAWSIDEAMSLIRQESGQHFDPTLVVLFDSILSDIQAYRDKNLDTNISGLNNDK